MNNPQRIRITLSPVIRPLDQYAHRTRTSDYCRNAVGNTTFKWPYIFEEVGPFQFSSGHGLWG